MKGQETALVTGASSGIGLEFARLLAQRGANLVLVARRQDRLEQLKAELEKTCGIAVTVIALDLCAEGAAQRLFETTRKAGLHISVLINNAGFGIIEEFLLTDPTVFERMICLNVTVLTLLTRLYGAEMKKVGHGRILQVSSIGAFQPCPYFSVYSATKAYVLSLGEALAHEMSGFGVTVTTLYPGNTATEFGQVAKVKATPMSQSGAMSAQSVAEAGLRALFNGRRALVTGVGNKINAVLVKFVPRALATRVAALIANRLRERSQG
jgi:short-subunit dehydrogenase